MKAAARAAGDAVPWCSGFFVWAYRLCAWAAVRVGGWACSLLGRELAASLPVGQGFGDGRLNTAPATTAAMAEIAKAPTISAG